MTTLCTSRRRSAPQIPKQRKRVLVLGLRKGEVLCLAWEAVNFEQGARWCPTISSNESGDPSPTGKRRPRHPMPGCLCPDIVVAALTIRRVQQETERRLPARFGSRRRTCRHWSSPVVTAPNCWPQSAWNRSSSSVAYSLIACSMAGEVQGLIADSFEEWATPPAQRMVGRVISVTQAGDLASVLLGFDNADDLSDGWVDLYTLLRIDRPPTPVDLDTLSPNSRHLANHGQYGRLTVSQVASGRCSLVRLLYFAEYRARSRE
jgi:hypothetical protein